MTRRTSRFTVLALLCALLFQLGAAAAAGLPSQSCCGTCDPAVAAADALPAPHCEDAATARHHHDAAPAHPHGAGPCPLCGDHAAALAPFVLLATAALPAVTPAYASVPLPPAALPAPMPHRLERPPRLA
ncbi:MAG: hypothetical protein U1F48_04640 [Burkholderiales bacterium]